MKIAFLATTAAILFCGCAQEETHKLYFELRVPRTLKFDPETRLNLVTDVIWSGTSLHLTERRDEGEFVVFAHSFLVSDYEKKRAIIVSPTGQPSQIFILSIPRRAKPIDWTEWQRPTYTDKAYVEKRFLDGAKDYDTNIPSDCFELRFQITNWDP